MKPDCAFHHRLEPYFEPPSKAEDANSPVGPLQHHVAEPDFVEWENIDWAALSYGHDASISMHTPRSDCRDESMGVESSDYTGASLGGSSDHICDFGSNCAYRAQFPFSLVDDALDLLMVADVLGVHRAGGSAFVASVDGRSVQSSSDAMSDFSMRCNFAVPHTVVDRN
jgi:hypothetical protein